MTKVKYLLIPVIALILVGGFIGGTISNILYASPPLSHHQQLKESVKQMSPLHAMNRQTTLSPVCSLSLTVLQAALLGDTSITLPQVRAAETLLTSQTCVLDHWSYYRLKKE